MTEDIEKYENYAPPEIKEREINEIITEADIIKSIQFCLKISPLIKPNKSLINSVYAILKGFFLDDKKYVIIEAPTGSGKTIIGFMVFYAVKYIFEQKNINQESEQLAYSLTSAKMLQEQIDKDLDRFDFRNEITMLKGIVNYQCIPETKRALETQERDDNGNLIKMVSYKDRPCKGLTKQERNSMYPKCDPICPYQLARFEASMKACSVLNYAYFLNVRRSGFNPFFGTRLITIADEAHLIPEIVCNTFNFEFNQYVSNQLWKLVGEIEINLGSSENITTLKTLISNNFQFFNSELKDPLQLVEYYQNLHEILIILGIVKKNDMFGDYLSQVNKNIERLEETLQAEQDFVLLVQERPEDVYFESQMIAQDKTTNAKVFKHIIRDLSESAMVKKHFLSKIDKGLFMSATLGDIDEYAVMMGMEPDEYVSLRLPSLFDFSESPIFICKSGYLNYANFDGNIDKVLMDVIKICNEFHPREKGIIHTSTFKICNLLKDKINLGLVPDKTRFLFYQNAEEKEKLVEMMKHSSKAYVLVGPSLYEGLDLKDEQGRFNILIKTPYAALDRYIKKKIERFPFWYERNTKEKIVQAIGRTNRHTNDYSKVYLLDSVFDKLIYSTNESIISRLRNLTIR